MSSSSSNDSSSDDESSMKFKRSVKFRKSPKMQEKQAESNEISSSTANAKLAMPVMATTKQTIGGGREESNIYFRASDIDPFTEEEKDIQYNLWKEREIARLMRDRLERLAREK